MKISLFHHNFTYAIPCICTSNNIYTFFHIVNICWGGKIFTCSLIYLKQEAGLVLMSPAWFLNLLWLQKLLSDCVLLTDDDECSLGTDNCRNLGPMWQCRNTLGSFRCERKRCDGKKVMLNSGECKLLECPTGYEASQQGQCIGKSVNNF
jgi:hypothetical protein